MFNESPSNLFNFNTSDRYNFLTGDECLTGGIFVNPVGNVEDLSNVQILHAGVDTYKGKFHGTVNRDFAYQVGLTLANGFDPVFNVGGHDFILSPSSKASRYKYKLHAKAMGVLIFFGDYFLKDDAWLEQDKGKIKFEISPQLIYDNGLDAIDGLISHFNQQIMSSFVPSSCDVHLCVDLQGWAPEPSLIEDMVTMTRKKRAYNGIDEYDFDLTSSAVRYGVTDSFLFGRASSSQCAIYNKTKEAQVKGNLKFWHSVWEYNNIAFNPLQQVFRIELRLPAAVLKNLVKRDDGTQCHIIDISTLEKHLNTLWVYGLSRLFRYDYNTSKSKIKTIKPIWQMLLEDVSFNDYFEPADYKREYITVDDSIDKNLALLMGNFTTVLAKANITEERMIETLQTLPFYYQLIQYAEEKKQLNEDNYMAHIVDVYRKKRVIYSERAAKSSLTFQAYRRSYKSEQELDICEYVRY